ncbi:MAG: 2-hydroxychromene-2-carboxylate isomerase [Gammaproteobacteria bacterium]
MPPTRLDFYFDFISLYACFAWRRLHTMCAERGVDLVAHPVAFGKLLDHWGQLGPAEIPPKKTFVYQSAYRYAVLHGFAFNPPRSHPFNPLPALRVALATVSGIAQQQVINTIFEAGWSHGAEIGTAAALARLLDDAGLDGSRLMQAANTATAKSALREETAAAIAGGVFGVPTMIVGELLFWGNDQLDHVALALDGRDPLDVAAVDAMLARPRALDRKRVRAHRDTDER